MNQSNSSSLFRAGSTDVKTINIGFEIEAMSVLSGYGYRRFDHAVGKPDVETCHELENVERYL